MLVVGVVLGESPTIHPPTAVNFGTSSNSTDKNPELPPQSLDTATSSGIPSGFGWIDKIVVEAGKVWIGSRDASPEEYNWSVSYNRMEPNPEVDEKLAFTESKSDENGHGASEWHAVSNQGRSQSPPFRNPLTSLRT